jgi:hypothetical protein
MWFGRRLLRSLGESAIWRGSFHHSVLRKFRDEVSKVVMLTVSPSFYLGRYESPLGLLESFPRALAGNTIAVACRPGDSRTRCEAGGGGIADCSRFAVRSVEASPMGRRLQAQWRYGLNGRSRANSLTDYFVTEAPPTARKASCFRQPISARIAVTRPQCGDLTCA